MLPAKYKYPGSRQAGAVERKGTARPVEHVHTITVARNRVTTSRHCVQLSPRVSPRHVLAQSHSLRPPASTFHHRSSKKRKAATKDKNKKRGMSEPSQEEKGSSDRGRTRHHNMAEASAREGGVRHRRHEVGTESSTVDTRNKRQ
ncbi:hypothetical protein C0Q70_05330 [Pomacea canaliculata]|uniref:Uncharacterized protein n=1 Tax=Pomacea canaliculata TaxID=400727 RepID=A0A2T7PKX4_POMCA|nr:hypothetical protein C0Q70_05330 [Pomacea canaliculata]